jgi:putative spermidine/putrescine transport system permease protein
VFFALLFVTLPFVVRTVQPVLINLDAEAEEAAASLGASPLTTFRRIVLPLAFPGLVAGSIFTFSLTLGDYITPTLFSGEQFIGNVIYSNVGVAGNVPLAAAYALVPVAVIALYLVVARRLGAFEAL